MMYVKECFHTFLLQIHQIDTIKHCASAQKRQKNKNKNKNKNKKKTRFTIFTKMVLNHAQGSKEKSQEVSVRKNVK